MSTTPRGFRDILPAEARARERISSVVRDCFDEAGYEPVETPLFEDRASLEAAGTLKGMPFQLFDSDRRLLVMRPDLTLPVARLAASRLNAQAGPLRLRYSAPVVREQDSLKGTPRQFTQLGVELLGEKTGWAECEVLELLAAILDRLGIADWRIVCGSVVPINALLAAAQVADTTKAELLEAIHSSDLVRFDELVEAADLPQAITQALHALPRLAGDVSVLDELATLMRQAGCQEKNCGLAELQSLVAALGDNTRQQLSFDFSIINSFDYYTGIVFKAYAQGVAASLGSGGRYDSVLARLGMSNRSACGFALSLERLQEALGEQGESGVARSMGTSLGSSALRIAVPKGSLFSESLKRLEAAGLPTKKLANPGRKLIISEDDVEYIIVRAQDAPNFVAFGGADCGICGSDSLIEADVDVVQLKDLGFGACRFVVAEPEQNAGLAEAAYAWRGSYRVASKYPRITQAYYDRLGQQVDIVGLHGNIELGPMVGMVDRIVDITATGTTLKENKLIIVDEIMSCSARFFATPAAYRLDERVRKLALAL